MNYLKAREILSHGKSTGLYHYTSMNNGIVHPVGYCTPDKTCEKCKGMSFMLDCYKENPCDNCNNKGFVRKENPCPGHETVEEACEHYRQYLLDNSLRFGVNGDQMGRCKVCNEFTQQYAIIDMDHYYLCDKHANREEVEKLYPEIGEIWSS